MTEPLDEDICRDDCTSGCHATDCEHHGHPATLAPDARLREAAQLLLDDLLCLRQSGGSRSRRPRASEMNLRALMDGLRLVSSVQAEVDALREALARLATTRYTEAEDADLDAIEAER